MSAVLPSSQQTFSAPHAFADRADGFFTFHGFWAPGVRLFRKLAFVHKAMLIMGLIFVPFVILVSWQLQHSHTQALAERQALIRQNLEVATGVLTWAHAQEQSGKVTRLIDSGSPFAEASTDVISHITTMKRHHGN